MIGGLAVGPDGNLWFTEGAHIGRMTPAGVITEFARPASDNAPGAIVTGPDGNLWFVEQAANALGRVTPQGVITQFPLPAGDTSPAGLTAGPDGALWYTRSSTTTARNGPIDTGTPGLIGRMTVDGKAAEFPLPNPPAPRPPAQPRDIVAGSDGALWFDTGMLNAAATGDSWIGRITTNGKTSIAYAPDPAALISISDLTAGPDHNIWFTQTGNNINTGGPPGGPPTFSGSVGRLTPGGDVKLFPLPSSVSTAPGAITAGPDGNLWFATTSGKIGRITASGQLTFFPIPDAQASIGSMTGGPGNAVWFIQSYGDIELANGIIWGSKIGRITS